MKVNEERDYSKTVIDHFAGLNVSAPWRETRCSPHPSTFHHGAATDLNKATHLYYDRWIFSCHCVCTAPCRSTSILRPFICILRDAMDDEISNFPKNEEELKHEMQKTWPVYSCFPVPKTHHLGCELCSASPVSVSVKDRAKKKTGELARGERFIEK